MNIMLLRVLFISAIIVIGSLALTGIYRRYTGLKLWQSALLCMWAAGLGITLAAYVDNSFHYGSVSRDREPFIICYAVLLPLLAVPFVIRLYRKWIGGHLTEAEKLPGIDGVRAWLGVGNIICAALISFCVWQAFGISPLPMLTLTFGAVLAYPLLNMASHPAQPAPVGPSEDLSTEREKVLQLLETGKITADESAELLNALGQTIPQRPLPASEMEMSPQRKIVLLGAVLLLVGFILPWFVVNPGAQANEILGLLQKNMQQTTGISLPQVNLTLPTGTAQVHAGDLEHGLGWWVLMLGIGAAALPFFATNLKPLMQKKVIIAALAIGAFLLVYQLSQSDWPWRNISIGFMLVLAGYALEVVGTLKERPAAS
jgi:hypothetical protein